MTNNTITREARFFIWLVVAVIGPFGLLLYLYPGGAGEYWAWRIAQPRTAMMVGAIYFCCGFYYAYLARQREWLQLKSSLRSLFVVAAWLLVAAMFHWDDFFQYRVLTLTWLGAYYLPLFAIPILFRIQSERFGRDEDITGVHLATGWRVWLIARAVVYGPLAVAIFIHASTISTYWPWPIEPLNIRIFSGQIAVFGAFPALAMGDGLWRRIRLFMMLTAGLAVAHLVALLVNGTPYNINAPAGRWLPAMFAEWLITSAALLWSYRNRK
ncbi:MAG: hypothetical protein JST22_01335 [Bacteroidetes bacterium]|nr:hypothetical protein [Bacteroidota bacterium]